MTLKTEIIYQIIHNIKNLYIDFTSYNITFTLFSHL